MTTSPDNFARYIRQVRYAPLGEAGQRKLMQSTVLVAGCGALGNVLASILVRAGVGRVRIVDRDFVETHNLQRQFLFTEAHAAEQMPKAVAAAEVLRQANSTVEIEPIVGDVNFATIGKLCDGADVVVDGTDNFETRFLINDASVKYGIPWVYGGCLGAEGQTMSIVPGETACLRCLMAECPPPGSTPTCDTAGVLGPIVAVIASIEAVEAMKILSGNPGAVSRSLTVVELWDARIHQVDIRNLRDQAECPCCKGNEFPCLSGREGSETAVLCGRNAVQLTRLGQCVDLDELARQLQGVGEVTRNRFLLRLNVDSYEITVFPDARAIVSGTDDPAEAKTVYARYVGS
ncbi:MAG: ThiF family adenylyltransferase [Thermoguttaceae bacterium]|jgi:adenylyltransferase/sulfurtransferase|nr:ThiF family adenylyltransferase [Thermoguttaceae bacterium]